MSMGKSVWNRGILLCQLLALIAAELASDYRSIAKDLGRQIRIEGGQEIGIDRHPYIVSLRRKACDNCAYDHYCGGTIFTEEAIITAASCVRDTVPNRLHVVAGSSLRTNPLHDGGMIFPVNKIIIHENPHIDLALLQLGLQLPLNNSATMKTIPLGTSSPETGSSATIAGWGQISPNGSYSEKLREVEITIQDREECKRILEDITDYEICSSYDACNGDAGGPLLFNGQLAGVISLSYGCGRPANPGVYTNIVRLSEWILYNALGVQRAFL